LNLYISEKPSVAQEFAKALQEDFRKRDGYMESEKSLVTWCVGHLITMSYPECYDAALKRWTYDTLPFLPKEYKYEVIGNVSKQFSTVKGLLNRNDVSCIYVCTDSGREGEYIYRLVDQAAKVPAGKTRKRVWIDSQTEEEILRGIREAKPLSAYDNLSDAAYLRAKEDYLMGINFSRVLTLKYGYGVKNYLNKEKNIPVSVGRVMTCVLGMLVRREREIRAFVKTPFYRVNADFGTPVEGKSFTGEFKAVEGSAYYLSPLLYKENGFREKQDALALVAQMFGYEPEYKVLQETPKSIEQAEFTGETPLFGEVLSVTTKKENKKAPLLFNLAELQNECAKRFKISPDETLKVTQELYERKLVTYPRTDARVLSTAVSKEIIKNIEGLSSNPDYAVFIDEIKESGSYKTIAKTAYVNDKLITDHYAIIPTGQNGSFGRQQGTLHARVYDLIVRRFLSIFYPPAVYLKAAIVVKIKNESFFANFKALSEEGYLKVAQGKNESPENTQEIQDKTKTPSDESKEEEDSQEKEEEESLGLEFMEVLKQIKKGSMLPVRDMLIKEGETAPPKRYNSGSLILAMENAGQLIEDEDLRAQIKGSGIGTSATRAEILNKLVKIAYLNLNKKTQIITPTLLGEMIYDVVDASIRALLDPKLTASWEKGLTLVTEGTVTNEEYMGKLEDFVTRMTNRVKGLNNQSQMTRCFQEAAAFYPTKKK